MSLGDVFLAGSRSGGERRISTGIHAEYKKSNNNNRTCKEDDTVAIQGEGPEKGHEQIAFPWIVRLPRYKAD